MGGSTRPEGGLRRLPPTLRTPRRTATAGCSKAPWGGLRFPPEVPGICAWQRFRRAPAGGDSGGDLVTPFMQVGI